jgi:hypothetical protein
MRISTTVLAAAAAAAIGAAFFFWTFPLDLLCGGPGYWNNPGDDPAQALMGYQAFAHDAWRLPLFRTELMNPPEGANVIFTDCIPIMALLGKLAYRATGHVFNYFGPWLLLCYLMQGIAGVVLARMMGIISFAAQLAVGVIFLFTPSFIFRFSHRPLAAHFLILIALILYLGMVRSPSIRIRSIFSGLVAITFLVNAYMLAMVSAIYLAGLAEALRRRTLSLRQTGTTLVLTLAGVTLCVVLSGGRQLSSAVGIIDGFGFYSMNLLSPVWPQLSGIFPWGHDIVDSTGGQYEGFNYLGVGVLALLVVALLRGWGKPAIELWRRHVFLISAAVIMALYALSLDIWIGSTRLTHFDANQVPILRSIAGTFRSSGRFFWPLGYVLAAGAAAIFVRTMPRRAAPALLAVIASLQALDSTGVRAEVLDRLQHRIPPLPLDRGLWSDIVGRHRAVIIEPHFICMPPQSREVHREILLIAAEAGIPANSAIVNRLDIDCDKERDQVASDPFAEPYGTPALHLFMAGTVPAATLLAAKPDHMTCAEAAFGPVCSSAGQPGFVPGAPDFAHLTVEPYQLGTVRKLDAVPGSHAFLGSGWSVAETWGTWAIGERSQILLPLPSPQDHDLVFEADVNAFGDGERYVVRQAAVWVNGQFLTNVSVPDTADRQIRIIIPRALASARQILTIEFRFDQPKSPLDIGVSQDRRHLTWGFKRFSLAEAS